MKKIIVSMFAIIAFAPAVMAEDTVSGISNNAPAEKTIIYYDVYKHIENSSHVFLGIGGLSLGIGTSMAAVAGGNALTLGAGLQTGIWGAAQTALYLWDRNFGEREKDPEKARQKYADMSGLHAMIHLAVMAAGGGLAIFGNETIKGHGIGIMIQGAMLAAYNSVNFFIASNPGDVKDWGAGVIYRMELAEATGR